MSNKAIQADIYFLQAQNLDHSRNEYQKLLDFIFHPLNWKKKKKHYNFLKKRRINAIMVLVGPVVQGLPMAAGQGLSSRSCPRAGQATARKGSALTIRHVSGDGDSLTFGWARVCVDSVLQSHWGRDWWSWGLEWGPELGQGWGSPRDGQGHECPWVHSGSQQTVKDKVTLDKADAETKRDYNSNKSWFHYLHCH